MNETTSSLVRDPQGVRAGGRSTGTAPVVAALALVASTGAGDDAVARLADELLDPIAGLAQGARALMTVDCPERAAFRDELLGLMYDRARELHDALIFYDWIVRPAPPGVT
jgi:hypothetical protein